MDWIILYQIQKPLQFIGTPINCQLQNIKCTFYKMSATYKALLHWPPIQAMKPCWQSSNKVYVHFMFHWSLKEYTNIFITAYYYFLCDCKALFPLLEILEQTVQFCLTIKHPSDKFGHKSLKCDPIFFINVILLIYNKNNQFMQFFIIYLPLKVKFVCKICLFLYYNHFFTWEKKTNK